VRCQTVRVVKDNPSRTRLQQWLTWGGRERGVRVCAA
jgi:hypothetical protein